jgi:transcriptional regulator with XRE-family HTH domain
LQLAGPAADAHAGKRTQLAEAHLQAPESVNPGGSSAPARALPRKIILNQDIRLNYNFCYSGSVWSFRPDQIRSAREAAGLTQQGAAEHLGVSQGYLALMETGRRRVTDQIGLKMVELYRLGPTALPLSDDLDSWDSASLAKALVNLGYPLFRRQSGGRRDNPAVVLLAAISHDNVEVRVVEGLPWLVVEYYDLNWEWLTREAKMRNVQNRLGFIVALAARIAAKRGADAALRKLREIEAALNQARLAREDSLCQGLLSEAERRWLRKARPADARHWNLLTDLDAEHLPYAV